MTSTDPRVPPIPRISVIIPAYNEESSLAACLETLGHQTYSDLEVVVVDDGSRDATGALARGFPVRVLEASHLGPAAARNRGARESRGEILVFVDADMRFAPSFVEKITEPIRAGRAAGTFSLEEYVANPENPWARCWSLNLGLPPDRRIPEDHPPRSRIFRAIERRRFLEVGGFTEGIGYTDDATLHEKLGFHAIAAPGAVCTHENPPSLRHVFLQARWIGRSAIFTGKPLAFLIYSPPGSLLRGLWIALRSGEPRFPIFKLIHDLGILVGMTSRLLGRDGGTHAK